MKLWFTLFLRKRWTDPRRFSRRRPSYRPSVESLDHRESPTSLLDVGPPVWLAGAGSDGAGGYTASGASAATGVAQASGASSFTDDIPSGYGSTSFLVYWNPGGGGIGGPVQGGFGSAGPGPASDTTDDAMLFFYGLEFGGSGSTQAIADTAASGTSGGGSGGGGSAGANAPPGSGAAPAGNFGTAAYQLPSGGTLTPLSSVAAAPGGPNGSGSRSGSATVTASGMDGNGVGWSATTTSSSTFTFSGSTADDGTWGYAETYVSSFDTVRTPDAAGGVTVHDWGTNGYTLTASGSLTGSTYTLVATQEVHETASQTLTTSGSDGATSTMTWTWHTDQQAQRTIWNQTDLMTGSAQGTDSGSGGSDETYTGSGSYRYALGAATPGTVTGTLSGTGHRWSSYSFGLTESRDAYGVVSGSGTWTEQQGGSGSQSYSGGGDYTVSNGGSDGGTGTAAAGDGSGASSGSWLTGGGTETESGSDTWSYATGAAYAGDGSSGWQPVSGSGTLSDTTVTAWGYTASGTYGYPLPSGSVTGTWQDSASDTTTRTVKTDSALGSDGAWVTTGTRTDTDDAGWGSGYTGGGSYTVSGALGGTPGASPSDGRTGGTGIGSDNPPDGGAAGGGSTAGSGTETEAGSDTQVVSTTAHYRLGSGGAWQPVSGSGTGTDTGSTSWGYTAGGTYGYALATGSGTGTWKASGGDTTTYGTAVTFTLRSDGTWGSTGTGTVNDANGSTYGYSGGGSYTVSSPTSSDGSWLTGTGTETESGGDTQAVSTTVLYAAATGSRSAARGPPRTPASPAGATAPVAIMGTRRRRSRSAAPGRPAAATPPTTPARSPSRWGATAPGPAPVGPAP